MRTPQPVPPISALGPAGTMRFPSQVSIRIDDPEPKAASALSFRMQVVLSGCSWELLCKREVARLHRTPQEFKCMLDRPHLSIYLSIYRSIYPSIHLSMYPSIRLSIQLTIYLRQGELSQGRVSRSRKDSPGRRLAMQKLSQEFLESWPATPGPWLGAVVKASQEMNPGMSRKPTS